MPLCLNVFFDMILLGIFDLIRDLINSLVHFIMNEFFLSQLLSCLSFEPLLQYSTKLLIVQIYTYLAYVLFIVQSLSPFTSILPVLI